MNYLLYQIINFVFQLLYLLLVARIILSWIQYNRSNEIIALIYKITDPILRPFQQIIPAGNIGIDISPILAFFALGLLKKLIMWIMF